MSLVPSSVATREAPKDSGEDRPATARAGDKGSPTAEVLQQGGAGDNITDDSVDAGVVSFNTVEGQAQRCPTPDDKHRFTIFVELMKIAG